MSGLNDMRNLRVPPRDDNDLGAVAVLAGALAWLAFVGICAVVGVAFADMIAGITPWGCR